MIVSVNGIDLYYEKTGEGRPLVLVHGNGEDHTIFNEAVAYLKDHYACYCVDSRGHGQSTPVDTYHYTDMAEDMVAFLEELDLRDVAMYGFSDGGIIGLIAAARTPRITSLIVSGANTEPEGVDAEWRGVFRLDWESFHNPLARLMLLEPHISDDDLRRITVPTLVLAGEHDLIIEEHTRHIAATIPHAELRILEHEDHGSYIEHSEKIGKILHAFLSGGPVERS